MVYTTVVDTETLANKLDSGWRLFDCRFVLSDPHAGERRYRTGHIPGAYYLHLDRDLAGPVTPKTGRHPLPMPESFVGIMRTLGVSSNVQVVAYDDASGAIAARLWWLLRWLGHRQVAVLDGGIDKWMVEKRPVTPELPMAATTGNFLPHPDQRLWVTSAQIERLTNEHRGKLLDARAASRFRGEEETIDPVAGHVPGAVNLPYTGNVSNDGCFKSPGTLRQRFEAALGGVRPADTVCMCGSGVTACHNLLAMEIAGLEGARLYAGSWSEWIRDSLHPVECG